MSPTTPPTSPSVDSEEEEEEEEEEIPECRVCGKNAGPPLCRFYASICYGAGYVGGDDTDCVHFGCTTSTTAKSDWAAMSVAQIKKQYGQGKAAKLALSKTRTAAGPPKFGNVTEIVLVKEFIHNLVAAGGKAEPKKPKATKKATTKKMSIAALRRQMKYGF
jgi:hypothetical protein